MSETERLYSPENEALRPDISFGMYVPESALLNDEIESWGVRTKSGKLLTAESIYQKTGISRRYVAENEDQIEMGVKSASAAMESRHNFTPHALLATTSYPIPHRHIASSIGHGSGARFEMALTGHFACSGGPEMLLFMHDWEDEFEGREVLLVASEKYSDTLADLQDGGIDIDPSLAQTIFSDGSVAMQFQYGRDIKVLGGVRHEFGEEESRCLRMPIEESAMVEPYIKKSIPKPTYLSSENQVYFEQDGSDVFRLVSRNVPDLIRHGVCLSDLCPEDIKAVIPHQGSGHIVDVLQKKLPEFQVYKNVEDGNFSSASTFKGLMEMVESGQVQKGDKVVLAGFGAGLYASIVVAQLGDALANEG